MDAEASALTGRGGAGTTGSAALVPAPARRQAFPALAGLELQLTPRTVGRWSSSARRMGGPPMGSNDPPRGR
eukprot:15075498-Alexandrium_andersonii.AAC.1